MGILADLFREKTKSRQDTEVAPLKELRPFVGTTGQRIEDFLSDPSAFGLDPAQQFGQQLSGLEALGGIPDVTARARRAFATTSDPGILFPESNPALQAAIDAAVQPIFRNFAESGLRNIRDDFRQAGQFASPQQALATGLAAERTAEAAGRAAAPIALGGFQTGLESLLRSQALAPTAANLGLLPGAVFEDIGATRRQAGLDPLAANLGFLTSLRAPGETGSVRGRGIRKDISEKLVQQSEAFRNVAGGIGGIAACYIAAYLYGPLTREHVILAHHVTFGKTWRTKLARIIYRLLTPLFKSLLKEVDKCHT